MEELAREVARLAWRLEREAEELMDWTNRSNKSPGSVDSVAQTLGRIERELGAVHGHTSELIERVPQDLASILTELKRALILRLEEASGATHSADSITGRTTGPSTEANHSAQSPGSAAASLSPQERRVFQLCFQSGFLSYRDIASHLDITPTAAKNLVNRIFLSEQKRPLFAKQYQHGAVRVGLQPDLQKRILTGASPDARKKRLLAEVEES